MLELGFIFHEAAHLLPLADAQVGCRVEIVTSLHECAHHLETQCFREFAQFIQRCLKFYVAHARQLYRGHDGPRRFLFDFFSHSEIASFRCTSTYATDASR